VRVLIGGSGFLGKFFFQYLSKDKKIYSDLISLRNCDLIKFKNKFNKLKNKDIFIDTMDPKEINEDFDINLNNKAHLFRKYALENSNEINYIYISTSHLYKPCIDLINETSKIDLDDSPYLEMKFNSERLVEKLCKSNFSILRIVNVWDKNQKNSFFGDLLDAQTNKNYIYPRNNDELVISFANILDISKIIKFVILNKLFGIINISTGDFNSRQNLKSLVNRELIIPISKNLGYRVSSNVIDWSKIIDKKTDLF